MLSGDRDQGEGERERPKGRAGGRDTEGEGPSKTHSLAKRRSVGCEETLSCRARFPIR